MNANAVSRPALRVTRLFEVFAQDCVPHSLTDLARAMRIPVSTCHGLVKSLQSSGYIYAYGEPQRLYPTKRLFAVAETISRHDPVIEYTKPLLAELGTRTAETVILGKRQGDQIVYLEVIEGPHVIRYSADAGDLKPLHSSALGKMFLGQLTAEELKRFLSTADLAPVTDNTLSSSERLAANLEVSRERGFYETRGENVSEVMALAAPMRLGNEVFGVAVAGPIDRMQAAREANASALLAVCNDVEGRFAA